MTIEHTWQRIQTCLDDPRFLRDLRRYLSHLIQSDHKRIDAIAEKAPTFHETKMPGLGNSTPPLVQIDGDFVIYDRRRLDLSRKPKALALFRAFLEAPELFLSGEELLELLYGARAGDRRSRRYLKCCSESMVKLLSRARLAATTAFGGSKELRLQWFAFDPALKGWHLYRVSDSYLRPHERIAAMSLGGECEKLDLAPPPNRSSPLHLDEPPELE